MNFEKIAANIINDLITVSQSHPNERLLKEEQIRSRTYASLLEQYESVCVERCYTSVDVKPAIECDIWAGNKAGEISWLEIKRCWSLSKPGWVNKPVEQHRSWVSDVTKLANVPTEDIRVFLLVGVFDRDPAHNIVDEPALLEKISQFHIKNLCFSKSHPFSWRDSPITHLGIWIWLWRSNEAILIENT